MTRDDEYLQNVIQGRLYRRVTFQLYDENGELQTYTGVYFLVDGGYGKIACLMDPIPFRTDLSEIYWSDSEFLESVRKDVECTFGILKMRWFILKKGFQFHSVKTFDDTFKTCCILHNMILN